MHSASSTYNPKWYHYAVAAPCYCSLFSQFSLSTRSVLIDSLIPVTQVAPPTACSRLLATILILFAASMAVLVLSAAIQTWFTAPATTILHLRQPFWSYLWPFWSYLLHPQAYWRYLLLAFLARLTTSPPNPIDPIRSMRQYLLIHYPLGFPGI